MGVLNGSYVYFVELLYPLYIEGRRLLSEDGTPCVDSVALPVPIPEVRQQGDAMVQLANDCLVTRTSSQSDAWVATIKEAADERLGVDYVNTITFTTFRIVENTRPPCGQTLHGTTPYPRGLWSGKRRR
jgi:hypothetical protein